MNGESDIGEVSILYQIPFRVGIRHTGFVQILIQNSRLHPDFFAKNMSLSNRWSTENLKKRRKKAFSMTCRRDWIRFDKHEKNFTCEGHVVPFKKRRLLPFFQDFPSMFQHFPCLENCWANFKTFSTIQDTERTLGIDSVNIVWYFTSYTPLHPRTPTDPIHMQSLLAVSSRIPETWSLWKRSSFKFMENITNKQSCNSNTWTCWSPVTTEGMLQLLTQPNQTLDCYLN